MENQVQNQTQMPPQQSTSQTYPAWIIILLLLFFPPLAWYFMWKDTKYHVWFPILLLIFGSLSLITSLITAFIIYPQLAELYYSLNVQKPFWPQYLIYIAVILGLLEIACGIYLFLRFKKNHILPKTLLTISVIILAMYYLVGPVIAAFAQLSVVTPIYNLTREIETDQRDISPTPMPESSYNPELTNGFPIYPEAKFIKKEKLEPCTNNMSGFALCGENAYYWTTPDNFDQVTSWFNQDPLNSGWKCTGGAGDYGGPRSAFGQTFCSKGDVKSTLFTQSTKNETEIVLTTGDRSPIYEPRSTPTVPEEPVFCTMEAKMCPDGTSVGRQGPNCEFAQCPGN